LAEDEMQKKCLTCASGHHLCDTDTFAFTTTDSSNEFISDEGVLCVGDIKHAQEKILDLVDEFRLGDIRKTFAGGFSREGKVDSLANSKSGIMHIAYNWREVRPQEAEFIWRRRALLSGL
jgi:hypothetical protein